MPKREPFGHFFFNETEHIEKRQQSAAEPAAETGVTKLPARENLKKESL
jgi:hypothetical protein